MLHAVAERAAKHPAGCGSPGLAVGRGEASHQLRLSAKDEQSLTPSLLTAPSLMERAHSTGDWGSLAR